ncbi:hypothetical protein PanWU01x14_077160 [Parasponia andersonii]|uniref:Uncharacterized protein n=1 Tax=Parasponia andersonii TaxID=3476 RepID=A0A2P5DCJ1_PARAD|nr:hypothetical protein PanWU01x14_077160 [Parasponia andersonii]
MGSVGNLFCVNANGRKQFRILFFRLRAALKKAAKNGSRRDFTFQYDPSSYALNFDDAKPQQCSDTKTIQWVYVLWVKYD